METATAIVFMIFLILLVGGLYIFKQQLSKESIGPMSWSILGFCGLTYLTLILSIWIFDPVLEAFFYLFATTGSVFIFWVGSIILLFNQFTKDKNREKLVVGSMISLVLIISIIIMWAIVGSSGPTKFWG